MRAKPVMLPVGRTMRPGADLQSHSADGCGTYLLHPAVAVRSSRCPAGAPDAGAGFSYMMVLVTGGTGFVGLNIVERLAAQGHDVIALGHAAPPSPLTEPVRRLGEVVIGDVCSLDALEQALA